MEHLRKEEIFALSGGQKQRIAIAAMLAMQSHILVLDKPTSDLDPVGTQEVMGVLRTLNKQHGWTIVLVKHKIDEVIPWVDRVVLMETGRIILDASPREAFAGFAPWQRLSIAVPQMVQLAHGPPDAFAHSLPLSVDEAYEVLRDTPYARALQQRSGLPGSNGNEITSSKDQILSWKGVHLAYGEKTVLKDVSLDIQEQEWSRLSVPMGGGKNLTCIAGNGISGSKRRLNLVSGAASQTREDLAAGREDGLFIPECQQNVVHSNRRAKTFVWPEASAEEPE